LKVILIGVNRNSERIVVIMYNNVDIISKTYEDIASVKVDHGPIWSIGALGGPAHLPVGGVSP